MPRSGPQERPEMKTECTKLTLHGRGRPRGHWEHDAQVKHRKKEETKKLKETKRGWGAGSRPALTEARPRERPWKESPVQLQNRRYSAIKMSWVAKRRAILRE